VTIAPVAVVAPELQFRVDGVEAVEHAAVPTLRFLLTVDAGGASVRALALNVQLRIVAQWRRYDEAERERLRDLFGPPEDWGRTLRSLVWTQVAANVPAFEGAAAVELLVPCTYDFDVAGAKYLHALDGDDVPLDLLFSGTVFFTGEDRRLQAAQIPWDGETRCSLPVAVWRDAVDRAFPGTAWLRIDRDLFERLRAFRTSCAHLTWDAALEELLGP